MKLFEVIKSHGGTFTVKCPDCGTIFDENDTTDSVAGCPHCPAMGYIDDSTIDYEKESKSMKGKQQLQQHQLFWKSLAYISMVASIILCAPRVLELAGMETPPEINALLVPHANLINILICLFLTVAIVSWRIYWQLSAPVGHVALSPFDYYMHTTVPAECAEIQAMVSNGKSHSEAIDAMVQKYYPTAGKELL